MLYRPLGRTSLKVSQLGLGAMRLPMIGAGKDARVDDAKAIEIIHHAFESGVNFIDSAVFYCNSDSQRAVGVALKGWRDKVVVSTKNDFKEKDEGQWTKRLEDSLRLLDIERIDLYNIHGLSWDVYNDAVAGHIGKWLTRAKDQGLIGHIGCSSHDSCANIIKIMDTGLFENIILQYNMLDRANEPAIAHAGAHGIGIAVMGPVAGGRLGVDTDAFNSVIPGIARVPELALRFVLANPAVSVAMSGMTSAKMIDENAAVASDPSPLSDADRKAIDDHLVRLKNMADLYCTGCGYCEPCPQNVRIPRIFRNYNLGRVYGLWQRAKGDYAEIVGDQWDPQAKQADACTSCGACEKKCPQKLPIRKQLAEAHAALKK